MADDILDQFSKAFTELGLDEPHRVRRATLLDIARLFTELKSADFKLSGDIEFLGQINAVNILFSDYVAGGRIVATNGLEIAVYSFSTNQNLTGAHTVVLVDATGGNRTMTLPSPGSVFNGLTSPRITVKKIDASGNTVTVSQNAAEKIDGANTVVLAAQWDRLTVVTNGTDWFRID